MNTTKVPTKRTADHHGLSALERSEDRNIFSSLIGCVLASVLGLIDRAAMISGHLCRQRECRGLNARAQRV